MRDDNGTFRCRAMQWLLGAVLIVASALKAYEFATDPFPSPGLFASRWYAIALVECELLFGLWLIAGLYPAVTWHFSIGLISILACISAYKTMAGEKSCGCFGKYSPAPWMTLVFDVGMLVALLACPPGRSELRETARIRVRMGGFAALATLFSAAALLFMIHGAAWATASEGDVIGTDRFQFFDYQRWVGERFPLLPHIDSDADVARGRWVVVLYRDDCEECRVAIPRYESLARENANKRGSPQIALIAIPPCSKRSQVIHSQSPCKHGRLVGLSNRLVILPGVVLLGDGLVEFADEHPLKSLELLNPLLETVARNEFKHSVVQNIVNDPVWDVAKQSSYTKEVVP